MVLVLCTSPEHEYICTKFHENIYPICDFYTFISQYILSLTALKLSTPMSRYISMCIRILIQS